MPARRSQREPAAPAANSRSEMSLRGTRNPNAQAAAPRGRGSARGRNAPASTAATRGQSGGRGAMGGRNLAEITTNLASLAREVNLPTASGSNPPGNASATGAVGGPTRTLSTSRLRKELANFYKEESEGCKVELENDNLYHWIATIPGPSGTPYEGGRFKMWLKFPDNYPFKAPDLLFKTKIYHCNINISGLLCLDILNYNWSPALSVSKLLISIMSLLADPNPNSPLNAEAASLYRKNRTKHDENARKWTEKYAK
ncbi:uncharacterized protein [Drosophila takahashii]|uniref:uncharacterized protein n=1 Tax=Drosophila takahashii TaxID=29030 RepID=UPI001CF922E9|nr:ubiquitin-conjugating enzyme E2 28-like [Drosophila takahashii]